MTAFSSETPFKNSVNRLITFHNQTTYTPYRRGTPDHWYSGKVDLWIEYKFVKYRPKVSSWETLLEPLQWAWCEPRYKEGRSVWVVTGYKDGAAGVILRSPDIVVEREDFDRFLIPKRQIANEIINFCQ